MKGNKKKRNDYIGRHRTGIALIPLGNRTRYIEFEDSIEERDSSVSADKWLKYANRGLALD